MPEEMPWIISVDGGVYTICDGAKVTRFKGTLGDMACELVRLIRRSERMQAVIENTTKEVTRE